VKNQAHEQLQDLAQDLDLDHTIRQQIELIIPHPSQVLDRGQDLDQELDLQTVLHRLIIMKLY
jgi:hypothetical protein